MQNIEKIKKVLLEVLEEQDCLSCINLLIAKDIQKICISKEITKEDIDFLYKHGSFNTDFDKKYHITQWISLVKNQIRERTSGGLFLQKVIISCDKYKEICEYYDILEKTSCCKIYGVTISTSSFVHNNNDIIGICDSNFSIVDYTNMIAKGRIE